MVFHRRLQRDWNQLPPPDGPLTVGIDGGYVRGRNKEHFEVISGQSQLAFRREAGEAEELSNQCLALVQTYDEKPKRRLWEMLRSQGLQRNQRVEFLSDGGEDVRNRQNALILGQNLLPPNIHPPVGCEVILVAERFPWV